MKFERLLEKYHALRNDLDEARARLENSEDRIRDLVQDNQVWKTRAESASRVLTRPPFQENMTNTPGPKSMVEAAQEARIKPAADREACSTQTGPPLQRVTVDRSAAVRVVKEAFARIVANSRDFASFNDLTMAIKREAEPTTERVVDQEGMLSGLILCPSCPAKFQVPIGDINIRGATTVICPSCTGSFTI